MERTTILFRPVGEDELRLIVEAGYKALPPRLPGQALSCSQRGICDANRPRLEGKAIKGRYVTGFAVKTSYLAQFPIHKVGGTMHTESGIPAEKLAEFQQNIVGLIEAVSEFRGK